MRTHEDRIFYHDASNGQKYSYSDLFKSLNMTSYEYENIYSNDIYRFFNRLLKSIILNKPQILIDNDLDTSDRVLHYEVVEKTNLIKIDM